MVCSLRLSRKLRLIQNKAQPTDSFLRRLCLFAMLCINYFDLFLICLQNIQQNIINTVCIFVRQDFRKQISLKNLPLFLCNYILQKIFQKTNVPIAEKQTPTNLVSAYFHLCNADFTVFLEYFLINTQHLAALFLSDFSFLRHF